VAQLYPQAPSTHFSRLLRHAWATVGLFFSPLTTRGSGVACGSGNDGDFGISGYRWVSVCLEVQRKTKRLGTALPSTLQSGLGLLRLPLFQALQDHLRGHHYKNDEVVQEAVHR
jgi:hypothetical protein